MFVLLVHEKGVGKTYLRRGNGHVRVKCLREHLRITIDNAQMDITSADAFADEDANCAKG